MMAAARPAVWLRRLLALLRFTWTMRPTPRRTMPRAVARDFIERDVEAAARREGHFANATKRPPSPMSIGEQVSSVALHEIARRAVVIVEVGRVVAELPIDLSQ